MAFNTIPEPGLRDVLDALKTDVMRSINCVLLGKIESVSLAKRTVSVSPLFKREMANGEEREYPLLTDCPIITISGGGASLDMPVSTGDVCVLLFNDRDLDAWFLSGKARVPNTRRAHSISDGFALVGVKSLVDVTALVASVVHLNAASNLLKLSGLGAELNGGAGKLKLKTDIGNLKTVFDTILTTLAGSTVASVPLDNASAILALKTTLIAPFLE